MTRLQRTTQLKAPSLLVLVIFQYFQLSKFYQERRARSGAYLIEELSPDNTPSCKLSTANKKLNMLMEIDLTKERNFFEFSNLQSRTNSIKRFEALESQKKANLRMDASHSNCRLSAGQHLPLTTTGRLIR